ncbi:MAG: TraR/DksA family transcriptional regulator [Nitrospinae bacterium]|nr:TraR/DksA family transcriptional regulator [Nitrospinota bacterium]
MGLTKEQLATLRDKLLQIRQALVNDVDNIQKHSNDEFESEVPDVNDDASRTYSRTVMLSRGEVDRHQLKLIDEALASIERGDYGTCTDCESEIPFPRLLSVPYVERCIDCMTKWEQSQTER